MTADFDYQQWRTASAETPEMLDSCLDRIAALEAELANRDKLLDQMGDREDKLLTQLDETRGKRHEAEAEVERLRGVESRLEQANAFIKAERREAARRLR